jgi:hypothetical protein
LADRFSNAFLICAQEADEEAFEGFFSELKIEASGNGEGDVDEEEARELYHLMKDEYNEVMSMDLDDLGLGDLSAFEAGNLADEDGIEELSGPESGSERIASADDTLINEGYYGTGDEQVSGDGSIDITDNFISPRIEEKSLPPEKHGEGATGAAGVDLGTDKIDDSFWSQVTSEFDMDLGKDPENTFTDLVERVDDGELLTSDFQLEVLREVLPTFSETRLHRVRRAFQTSLGDPSLLDLVPLVRERMPDYITATWLKQMSALTSRFVMHKAAQDGLVDTHMLNGALELETASGSLDKAIQFYETNFEEHGLEPNGYSDRMMIQMFLKNNRLSRALAFKQTLELSGKTLDIPSYGSLIDFCSRRGQLGSALMFLKECVSVHKAAPGEAAVSQLRILCRQADITDEVGLADLAGEDPVEWLRHGEAHLKREYSKKGKRDVQMARNRLVHI